MPPNPTIPNDLRAEALQLSQSSDGDLKAFASDVSNGTLSQETIARLQAAEARYASTPETSKRISAIRVRVATHLSGSGSFNAVPSQPVPTLEDAAKQLQARYDIALQQYRDNPAQAAQVFQSVAVPLLQAFLQRNLPGYIQLVKQLLAQNPTPVTFAFCQAALSAPGGDPRIAEYSPELAKQLRSLKTCLSQWPVSPDSATLAAPARASQKTQAPSLAKPASSATHAPTRRDAPAPKAKDPDAFEGSNPFLRRIPKDHNPGMTLKPSMTLGGKSRSPRTAPSVKVSAAAEKQLEKGAKYAPSFLNLGYRFKRQIGEGGMGVVMLADQVDKKGEVERDVAIKVMTDVQADSEDVQKEQKIGKLFNQDDPVVLVYEAGEVNDVPYIVMPNLGKVHDFSQRKLRELPETINTTTNLVSCWRMAQALEVVHGRGIVHKDIKGANFLARGVRNADILQLIEGKDAMKVYISDFGIGKKNGEADQRAVTVDSINDLPGISVELKQKLRTAGYMESSKLGGLNGEPVTAIEGVTDRETVMIKSAVQEASRIVPSGTPRYMSPEQARTEEDVTQASDVFSLGVTFYETLTGHLPYSKDLLNKEPMFIMAKIAFLKEPPFAEDDKALRAKKVPKSVREMLVRMVALKPEDRPAMAEVTQVFGEYVNSQRPDVQDAEKAKKDAVVAKRTSQTRGKFAAVLVGALALGGSAFAYKIAHERPEADTSFASNRRSWADDVERALSNPRVTVPELVGLIDRRNREEEARPSSYRVEGDEVRAEQVDELKQKLLSKKSQLEEAARATARSAQERQARITAADALIAEGSALLHPKLQNGEPDPHAVPDFDGAIAKFHQAADCPERREQAQGLEHGALEEKCADAYRGAMHAYHCGQEKDGLEKLTVVEDMISKSMAQLNPTVEIVPHSTMRDRLTGWSSRRRTLKTAALDLLQWSMINGTPTPPMDGIDEGAWEDNFKNRLELAKGGDGDSLCIVLYEYAFIRLFINKQIQGLGHADAVELLLRPDMAREKLRQGRAAQYLGESAQVIVKQSESKPEAFMLLQQTLEDLAGVFTQSCNEVEELFPGSSKAEINARKLQSIKLAFQCAVALVDELLTKDDVRGVPDVRNRVIANLALVWRTQTSRFNNPADVEGWVREIVATEGIGSSVLVKSVTDQR